MPSSIHGRFASSHMYMYSYSMLGNRLVAATKDMLTRHLPMPEVHSTCNYHNGQFFSWLVFWLVRVIGVMPLIHENLTGHTTSSPLSSHTTHSHFIISVSKQAISTAFANFLISSSLKSKDKVMETSSALYFDYHTPIQILAKPTEALDTALVCVSSHQQTQY